MPIFSSIIQSRVYGIKFMHILFTTILTKHQLRFKSLQKLVPLNYIRSKIKGFILLASIRTSGYSPIWRKRKRYTIEDWNVYIYIQSIPISECTITSYKQKLKNFRCWKMQSTIHSGIFCLFLKLHRD